MIISETALGIFLVFIVKISNKDLLNKKVILKINQFYFFPFKSFISIVENYLSSFNSKISLSIYTLIRNILNKRRTFNYNTKVNIHDKFFYKNFFQLVNFHNTNENIIKDFKNIIINFYYNHFPELISIPLKFTKVVNLMLILSNKKNSINQIDKKTLLLITNIIGDKNYTKKVIYKYIWHNRKTLKKSDKFLLTYIIKSLFYLIKLKKNTEIYTKKIFRLTMPNIYNFAGFDFVNKLLLTFGTLLDISQAPVAKLKTLISSQYFKKYICTYRNFVNINNYFLKCDKNNFYDLKNKLYQFRKIKSFISLKVSLLAKVDIYMKNINESLLVQLKKKVSILRLTAFKKNH